jgi:YegS/Rv2252/BmrU family lipid kinase
VLGKTLVIVNPAARHGVTRDLIPMVSKLLDGHVDYELLVTECPGHAIQAIRQADGYQTVVAMGGDGTVHEVLNGIMAREPGRRPALALLPTGSGNDYRRTLGISTDLATAARQLINGQRATVDVGLVNDTYFANSVAVGLDARVTAKAIELKAETGWSGIPLYMRALMSVLFRDYRTHPMTMSIDGGAPVERDVLLVAVTNGPTYGGGFKITPGARADDGVFDVCTIDKISLPSALVRIPFLVFGHHGWMRPITIERHRSIHIESPASLEGQMDGEVVLASTYDISILPSALDVIVPRK